jgi:hypothetical protein
MEGAGLCAAAIRGRVPWILVKAVCDWADGTKHKGHQPLAAASAASLVHHVFSHATALHGLDRREQGTSGSPLARPAAAAARIEFVGAGGTIERRTLARGETLSIGRAGDMDVVFDDSLVSAHHARFTATEAGLRVADTNSKNKVFVNGVEIQDVALKKGDKVQLGKRGPLIRVAEALAATKTEEAQ